MAERKVLQKYYPPDFDPSKIGRAPKDPNRKGPRQQTVRLMAPFSMRCNSCGEYIYKGKKFNARKEDPQESYLGIKIWRFYIRCTRCNAEITFKTDPQNADYIAERGAQRNFEPWRQAAQEKDDAEMARLEEEEQNAMQMSENRTMDSKRDMEIMDALDDIRTQNARNERIKQGMLDGKEADILKQITDARAAEERKRKESEEREIEESARRVFRTADGQKLRRIADHTTHRLTTTATATQVLVQTQSAVTPAISFAKPAAPLKGEPLQKKQPPGAKLGITVKKKARLTT